MPEPPDDAALDDPLHDQFEWNDSAAAVQWRLAQARELIRSVKVEVQTERRIVSTVRYVRDPSAGEEQGYVDVNKLRGERDLAVDALLSELKGARALLERAYSLAEALGLSNDFDDLKERVELIRGKLDQAA